MKKVLLIAFLATGLWATENLGQEAEIATKCSSATALGIKSSLSTLDLENMSAEDKSKALLEASGTFSHFYEYCVAFYHLNIKFISAIEPEFVLQDFIAKTIAYQQENREKDKQ